MFSKGFKLREFRLCENCNYYNEEDAKFCINCGCELFHPQKQMLDFIYNQNPGILVSLMAKIVKADNKPINKTLADFISEQLNKIDIFYKKDFDGFRPFYPKIFEIEKNSDESIAEICTKVTKLSDNEAEFIIVLLLDLVYFDGFCSKNEDILIERIVIGLGINMIAFRAIKKLYTQKHENNQDHNYDDNNNDFNASISLSEAYKILGCKSSDDFETIKRAYKQLVLKFHPDTLSYKDLPPELLKIAEEKFKKINLAYDLIKKSRGF